MSRRKYGWRGPAKKRLEAKRFVVGVRYEGQDGNRAEMRSLPLTQSEADRQRAYYEATGWAVWVDELGGAP